MQILQQIQSQTFLTVFPSGTAVFAATVKIGVKDHPEAGTIPVQLGENNGELDDDSLRAAVRILGFRFSGTIDGCIRSSRTKYRDAEEVILVDAEPVLEGTVLYYVHCTALLYSILYFASCYTKCRTTCCSKESCRAF